jgi:hypothetical protein
MLAINTQQIELLQTYCKSDTDALSYLKELDKLNLGLIGGVKGMLASAADSAREAVHKASAPRKLH